MILNCLKSTKPPKRVCISLWATRAPEPFCFSLASSFLCSPVHIKQELLCLRISSAARWKALRVTLCTAHCWDREFCSSPFWIYNQTAIPAPSSAKGRIAAPWIFWSLLTGGVTGNINMLTLRHQMCEELLQRFWFITSLSTWKFST